MPENKQFNQVRGRVIRATRLDACGAPIPGTSVVSVSKKVSSITTEEVTEDGTNIRERNFYDEFEIVDVAFTSIIGYTAEIALMGVNPALINVFTNQPLVKNAAGDTVGFDVTSDIDLDSFGFALEVWSRITGTACGVGGRRPWGYTVFPFFKGGRLTPPTFENGPVSFTVTGSQTRVGNQWGVGPFDVDLGVGPGFAPSPLFTPLGVNTHYRNILVTKEPPTPSAIPTLIPV